MICISTKFNWQSVCLSVSYYYHLTNLDVTWRLLKSLQTIPFISKNYIVFARLVLKVFFTDAVTENSY